jgi:predicted CXXCH cytochrome family protein
VAEFFTAILCVLVALLVLPAPSVAQAKDSCLECHAALPDNLGVAPEQFAADIHAQKGLTCVSCHGGDATRDDAGQSMSRAAGFRGKITRPQIPELCARCHSDAAYMRGFNPAARTDQLSQYRTSVHGQRLARGDARVAVCTDCHSVHDIRPARDARSHVHPTAVAQTCAQCHASAEHMKGYSIPTDQFASYQASVHHEALTVRGDLSAPACSTCHGNHGAAPPGLASVEFVCSTCHAFQAQLFDSSPHKPAFAAMGLGACVTCHLNHRIQRTGDFMLGTGKQSLCVTCHAEGEPGFQVAAKMRESLARLEQALLRSEEVVGRAERSGMEVGQVRLELLEGRDSLTKARVAIHAFALPRLDQDIAAGLKIAEKTHQAGLGALAERDFRRKGLALSLLTIVAVLVALRLFLRELERTNTLAGSNAGPRQTE